jgi:Flp pilus assembly protein TadG
VITRWRRRGKDRTAGQAMVEFALVAPILFAVLFGLIDGSRLVFAHNSLAEATREAARLAAVQSSHIAEIPCRVPTCPATTTAFVSNVTARATAMVQDAKLGLIVYVTCTAAGTAPPTGAWTTHNDCASSRAAGGVVSIRVVAQIRPITPVLAIPFPTISMTATSSMTIP